MVPTRHITSSESMKPTYEPCMTSIPPPCSEPANGYNPSTSGDCANLNACMSIVVSNPLTESSRFALPKSLAGASHFSRRDDTTCVVSLEPSLVWLENTQLVPSSKSPAVLK